MKYEILKFKIAVDKVFCRFQVYRPNHQDYDAFEFTTADKPAPALLNKIMEFRKPLLELCELPAEDEEIRKVEVTSFSFSWSGEKHIMGATITGERKLKDRNSPLILNTPHLIEDWHSDKGDEKQLLPRYLVELIYSLFELIIAFIDGEREQLDLFNKAG